MPRSGSQNQGSKRKTQDNDHIRGINKIKDQMAVNENVPLAVRMRPRDLGEFAGQKHILGEGRLLRRAIISRKVHSLILWGPPGTGKTSLGFIIAERLGAEFRYLNAAFTSVTEVKKIIVQARKKAKERKKTIIFIDEIHRFNRSQQEVLVPDTETSNIILIGATIYNPYYYIIPSLISRSIVSRFETLTVEDITSILKRALEDKACGIRKADVDITDDALEYIASASNGDARGALSALELGVSSTSPGPEKRVVFDIQVARESIQKRNFYDRRQTYHYDHISAFIKSIRGSGVDSALYWLAKMLKGGEDPRFIARRLVILASEDIGNADPFALVLAVNCFKAVELLGMPEAELSLAQTVIYLSAAPKSNSAYLAINEAKNDLDKEKATEVPRHLKTHSKDYKYPHNFSQNPEQNYGVTKRYYRPKGAGEERRIKDFFSRLRDDHNAG